ncbi:MAG: bifunctional 3-deoxy-7-phosphoheptulonate synthase/chorismate mutase type II [Flavobacteriales bacterium]|nr:bifunctional 3-deoxy-7-phosphoheptulonate synthase/chorismate mutase type II [Flavobacteriales bacterium]
MSNDRAALEPALLSTWGDHLSRPLLIAGPCSAESEEQVMVTARGIVKTAPGVRVFRAGVWKPRTRPGAFEGMGEEALVWLQRVKRETGLFTATEVATPEHVDACLRHGIDMLWIGARTTPNPFSVQAIADALRGVDIPVMVKNPINPDLQLWVGALERLHRVGIRKLAAVHRGFSWSGFTPYRNSPMWEFPIRLAAAYPELPLLCDPSHIAGKPEKLHEVAQKALDLNFSGLMVETHHAPASALSDADQQIDPHELRRLLGSLSFRAAASDARLRDRLEELRDLIDHLDADIAQKLGARMDLSERIGAYKRDHNVAILQPERWERIMSAQAELGRRLGLSPDFIEGFMNAIHQESIRRQTEAWEQQTEPSEGSPVFGPGRLQDPG